MRHEATGSTNAAMGRRLKSTRELLGLSQQQLAAMIHTSQSCISLWENGVNGASVACFFQLADALQVDPCWLATGRSDSGLPSMPQAYTPESSGRYERPHKLHGALHLRD